MELFKNVRLKISKVFLRRKMATTKRKLYYSNLGQVKKIGIVWDASNTGEFSCLSRFYQKMHERNIEVTILGYFPGKNLPDQYTAIRYLTCLRRKELNFLYQPDSPESNSFISNRFDIVIDINFKKQFPLLYILSLSNAAFKVGLFEPETVDTPFDLMIEIKNPVDVDNYLIQVIQYLEMINSGPVKTANK
ncbi:MAG: hypothetical protein WCS03_04410 [Bacteroidota bacterium]